MAATKRPARRNMVRRARPRRIDTRAPASPEKAGSAIPNTLRRAALTAIHRIPRRGRTIRMPITTRGTSAMAARKNRTRPGSIPRRAPCPVPPSARPACRTTSGGTEAPACAGLPRLRASGHTMQRRDWWRRSEQRGSRISPQQAGLARAKLACGYRAVVGRMRGCFARSIRSTVGACVSAGKGRCPGVLRHSTTASRAQR